MKLILIAAEAANKVIGNNGKMPWHIPEDLQHFKNETKGYPVIMGRKTWESIGSKPLPERTNVIISKSMDPDWKRPYSTHLVPSFRAAVKGLIAGAYEKAYVIGGEQLFRSAMPWASQIVLTKLYKSYEGDTFFPDMDPREWVQWQGKENFHNPVQPFSVHYYTAINQPDVDKWVDLIKD